MTILRIPTQLHQAVMRRLRTDLSKANTTLQRQYPEPIINYRQRGTTAGSAHMQSWEIRLNATLLIENKHLFIDEVIPHELAHLLVFRHFGRVAPHGTQWRYMMEEVLGIPAKRTHRFETSSVQGKTFLYRCQCQTHQLTLRRHNKVLKGLTEYLCRQCGHSLQFTPIK